MWRASESGKKGYNSPHSDNERADDEKSSNEDNVSHVMRIVAREDVWRKERYIDTKYGYPNTTV